MKGGQSADGCGCNKWCRERNHPSGICGDGDTCICEQHKQKGCYINALRGEISLLYMVLF